MQSVTEIRRELSSNVTELRDISERMQTENQERADLLEKKLHSAEERMLAAEMQAKQDELTGIGNRRMAENAIQSAISSGIQFSMMLFDLDRFKEVNDRCGNLQGDHLLKAVAGQLRQCVRGDDLVCRWGGDEFMVVLPNTGLEAARSRAEHIQADAFGQFVLERGAIVTVTASVGVAQHLPDESAAAFFDRVDQLMYEKKARQGRTAAAERPSRQ